MRPGVLDVRANPLWPTSALISDDLPTLERPAKAISVGPSGGRNFIAGTPRMKIQGRPNSGLSSFVFVSAIDAHSFVKIDLASRF
ncbi:hypothetical protein D9M69_658420 [compost metagenome]